MRDNLATDVADELRRRISGGELEAGSRLREGELAALLEVSRTPVREALSRLAAEGFVENHPRRGFFVHALGPVEAGQLYGIRTILDPAALRLAGLPPAPAIERLEELNRRIADSEGGPDQTIQLDDRWHLELLAGCPNDVLLDLIRQFMRRTRPLERAYVRDQGSVAEMVGGHARILAALRDADLEAAVAALRANMESGLGTILAWLATRPEPEPPAHA